jgi:uncharacterized membrane protein
MILLMLAVAAAGLFAGAAIYVTAVEHPARLSCGPELAIREFAPSYKRGAVMQASLAVVGCLAGLSAAWQRQDLVVCAAALLLGSLVPFTLVVIFPTNKRLLDPTLDPRGPEASQLLTRWGRLHAVRTVLSTASFVLLVVRGVAVF